MSENSSSSRPPHRPTKNQQTDLDGLLGSTEDGANGGFFTAVEEDEYSRDERDRTRRRSRNFVISAGLVFAVALVLVVSILAPQYGWFERKDYSGEGNGTEVTFTIPEGASAISIANSLEEQGIIANADRFLQEYSDKGQDRFFQPGEYTMQEEMSSAAALGELLRFDEANTNYVAVARTWRMDKTFEALATGTGISAQEFKALSTDPTRFGIPSQFPTIEGFLFPGEYRFPKDAGAEEILQMMVDNTFNALEEAGVSGDDRIFHVITVASILEFEGREADYYPIAGAIENRLNNPDGETSGYLQSDATVAYGLGIQSYHISNEQKQDASNKYNTFYYKGLPEGPIGSPGLAAIKAAANPEKNDYYFWVTVDLFTGETLFAKTYEEHLKNVEVYDEFCKAHEGVCS
ncbi:MAG TPA: endolytic transglycosylase MltG [Candidatus Rothia avistercoris]|uniref:Endolytic murein transglycosylase n=1 Tax=Candidatus Rothia avistercoris TaxID=2840479 RepID=A0A9D2UDM3_9MICC|nr:endolytic transglycosylase MltG [Candidatus Rothia avistercoris]